ncbi:enoyl-CoA hydratase-related protein [Erythrobacter sp. EC-HK427]|uniref:enoyl-CoA hydratase-related protein n=1 Tax=Erythrobacter sp. EC-HK427 TaxID=2038396 RepID=UPI00125211CE|nr:enoyl-CoA hydratase-related protein [Erythrobacter sp. EC-HK427]VVT06363.1 acyl-CoA hydratase [Erythrobacter sp. EC-HK427]
MADDLLYSFENDIATITLNAPDKLNSLSPSMLTGLPPAFARAQEDGARCIIFTGSGRAFCTGARLGPDGIIGDDLGAVLQEYYEPVARAMADCDVPIVTAMNGVAAGAGLGFALMGDIVIAARSAELICAFARIGLVPDAGTTWLLAKSIGRAKALEMMLLAEAMPAEEAARLGLIARVVDDGAFEAEVAKVTGKLAKMPTRALGMIRKQATAALDSGFEGALAAEAANQTVAGRTHDFMEGVMAFIHKRMPDFKGK